MPDSQGISSGINALDVYRRVCPCAFYVPNKPAPADWIIANGGSAGTRSEGDRPWFENEAKLVAAIGGNRAGKTTKLVLEMGSNCVGFRPWYPESSEWRTKGLARAGNRQVRNRYILPNFETHLSEVIFELKKWWPQEWWKISMRNERGSVREIEFYTGNTCTFMSHKQNVTDFEGTESDRIFYDEPPPRNVFTALQRGLVSTGGRGHMGCTLLDASGWFWDEVVTQAETGDKDILVTWHSMWDNTAENGGYERQTVANVMAYLKLIGDPDERLAREHGHPMHVGGLVVSSWDPSLSVVEPFDLPDDVVILSSIDPAGSRPFAGLHCAVIETPEGKEEAHFFDETFLPATSRDLGLFCQIWKEKEAGVTYPKHPSRSVVTLIDPFANEPQKADRTGRTMREILYEDYGILTQDANRAGKRARLLRLNARIKEGSYRVWSSCRRMLIERRRWSWDDKSPKLTRGPDDLWDNASYIDAADPFMLARRVDGEEPGGVWVPKRYREVSQDALDRRIAELEKQAIKRL